MKIVNCDCFNVLGCVLLGVCVAVCGCDSNEDVGQAPAKPKPESIINKTTQEIGEYDPAAGKEIVEDVKVNIVTGAAGAMGPLLGKVSAMSVQSRLEIFKAIHERYPRDHAEFMSEVIHGQDPMKLPMPVHGTSYEYDVAGHRLVLVKDAPTE